LEVGALKQECGDRRHEGLSKMNAIASPKNTKLSPERIEPEPGAILGGRGKSRR
jgi:hypothetical protein